MPQRNGLAQQLLCAGHEGPEASLDPMWFAVNYFVDLMVLFVPSGFRRNRL